MENKRKFSLKNIKRLNMKELSIEEKAKAYDKALVIAKSRYSTENEESVRICLELMFPELQENEDERMMNNLHSWMKEFGGAEEYTEKVHQWIKGLLEKQGERKPVNNQFTPEQASVLDMHIDKFIGQKPADKFEPKFKKE